MTAISTTILLCVLAFLFAVFLPVWPFNKGRLPVAASFFAGAFVCVSILAALRMLGAL